MSPLTNYVFGVAMGGLLLKLQNFKKVKLIFGHPVFTRIFLDSRNFVDENLCENGFSLNF